MMRIALFLLTNLAVMVVFGLVLSLTGIQSSSVQGLLIMALLFGFGGSFISLLMSKWMALKSVGGEVIEQPRNDMEQWLMNTVAQQSRQAGIAMPQVAIYHAPDINAFATGARRDASLVAVSTGLLQNMSRDEAEAVARANATRFGLAAGVFTRDGARGHRVIWGTPSSIADQLQEWFEHGAADGFNVMPPVITPQLELFASEVVPILRKRGLFRSDYQSSTLRGHFGLPDLPAVQHRLQADAAVAA